MTSPFDQLGKKIGLRALGASGHTTAQHEIPSNARQADLCHEPDPAREAERARLGLLGRLASVPCLIEIFSSTPGEEKIVDCVGKLIAYRQERRREAHKTRRRRGDLPGSAPVPPFVPPVLWVVTAGRPTRGISILGALPAEGWPAGVSFTPAGHEEPGGLRVGFVVASELPRERATILVRIMAGGTALATALADLAALPAGAYEREVASADVLELRELLGHKPKRTREEEAFIVSTRDIVGELRAEAAAAARAHDVLTVLRVRGIAVPDAARERILAEKDPSRLGRWHERAVLASSIAEVMNEPS